MRSLTETVMLLVDRFAVAEGINAITVSKRVFGSALTIRRLQSGGDITTRNYERALRWFSDHWPEGEPWPDGVDRPPPSLSPPSLEQAS